MQQNLQNAALLIMDMQETMLSTVPIASDVLPNAVRAIAAARINNIPVIYVTVGFRPGAPEININNKSFAGSRERMLSVNMEQWLKIHPAVAPLEDEVICTKRRFSAFTGSDLEVVLRAKGIQHIVLTGFSTSGVVLSTLREAADKDYNITVLADCCGDRDEEVHRVLISKVFPRQADVVTADEWITSLS